MENYEFNENLEPTIDFIIEQIKSQPVPAMMVSNFKRFSELFHSRSLLQLLLSDSDYELKVEVNTDPMFSYGCIHIETDDLIIRDFSLFSSAVLKADNIEFYPLLNGKLRISLMFSNIFIKMYTTRENEYCEKEVI